MFNDSPKAYPLEHQDAASSIHCCVTMVKKSLKLGHHEPKGGLQTWNISSSWRFIFMKFDDGPQTSLVNSNNTTSVVPPLDALHAARKIQVV